MPYFLFLVCLIFFSFPAIAVQKQIGASCKGDASSYDWDALAQCNGANFEKAPLQLGAVSSPRYPTTNCDFGKAGMIQWTGSAFQGCDGKNWVNFVSVSSGTFGAWETKNLGTVYLAETDGFVVASIFSAPYPSVGYISGYTDAANPPTVRRSLAGDSHVQALDYLTPSSFTMPVKRGEYWRTERTTAFGTAPLVGLYWIPIQP